MTLAEGLKIFLTAFGTFGAVVPVAYYFGARMAKQRADIDSNKARLDSHKDMLNEMKQMNKQLSDGLLDTKDRVLIIEQRCISEHA